LTSLDGDELVLRAALFSPDGAACVADEARFAWHDTTAPAQLAATLLARAPTSITDHFAGPALAGHSGGTG
jgi:hydroxymethylbilane synthase